ncbi:MAG: hypothetical protein RL588_2530 [Pseudomonadota bacterium]|jgi:polar amino acid transport system substrate-binding protein
MKANLSGLILALSLAASPAAAGALEDALGRGALRVCTSEAPPFVIRTPGGELIGHEVDIAGRLASDAGLTLDLRVLPMGEVLDRLNAGECDLAAAALAVSPDKLLKVWMSDPYAETDLQIVASSKAPIRIDQLNVPDTAIGIVSGTMAADAARSRLPEATFREFADLAGAQRALDDGAVNALAFKEPIPSLTVASSAPQRYVVASGDTLGRTADAFALRKGDANMLNFLNGWISARKRDGFLASTDAYWLNSLDWMARVKTLAPRK